jgi:hypothetical protein
LVVVAVVEFILEQLPELVVQVVVELELLDPLLVFQEQRTLVVEEEVLEMQVLEELVVQES